MNVSDFIPTNQFRYYYTILNKTEKRIYDALVRGFETFSECINVEGTVSDRIYSIFNYIKYDIPELFYVKTISLRYYQGFTGRFEVFPSYRFNKISVCSMMQEMDTRYQKFIEVYSEKNEIIKEQAIHDSISGSVKYKDTDKPYSHEAPGTLLYDIGVCEGISKATKWLCDRLNLKCAVAIGNTTSREKVIPHAWNIIWINSLPYHVDVTYDKGNTSYGRRYDYYNLNDSEIYVDRIQTKEYPLPKCQTTRNWYMEHQLFFHSKRELIQKLRNMDEQKVFSFQLPLFTEKRKEAIDIVNSIISHNINPVVYRNRSYHMYYNLDRMVFEVVFSADPKSKG